MPYFLLAVRLYCKLHLIYLFFSLDIPLLARLLVLYLFCSQFWCKLLISSLGFDASCFRTPTFYVHWMYSFSSFDLLFWVICWTLINWTYILLCKNEHDIGFQGLKGPAFSCFRVFCWAYPKCDLIGDFELLENGFLHAENGAGVPIIRVSLWIHLQHTQLVNLFQNLAVGYGRAHVYYGYVGMVTGWGIWNSPPWVQRSAMFLPIFSRL